MYLQAPVGNCTSIDGLVSSRRVATEGLSAVRGWSSYWYDSGTMALAIAVQAARITLEKQKPAVVLAAYGCPDVVAAIKFAGAEPLYVDLEHGRVNMDPAEVRCTIEENKNICAVIGTDLFGISENWEALKSMRFDKKPVFIQDCAQSIQPKPIFSGSLQGDFVAFSFGRGKPVCLLGGGALMVSDTAPENVIHALKRSNQISSKSAGGPSKLRLQAYNILLNPRVYSLLAMILGKRLGRTRFTPLKAVRQLAGSSARKVDSSVEWFWNHHLDQCKALDAAITPILRGSSGTIRTLIPIESGDYSRRTYLRMPLVTKSPDMRDKLVRELVSNGISATAMYKRILPDIVDAQEMSDEIVNYPNARHMADRLLTIPVHNRLSSRDIDMIADVLRACLT